MEEAYRQARKRGEQGRRRAISQSEHPYLTDLDSLVAQLPLGQRENVGLRDIPLEMVVGTVTKGRQSAFSCNFMPCCRLAPSSPASGPTSTTSK